MVLMYAYPITDDVSFFFNVLLAFHICFFGRVCLKVFLQIFSPSLQFAFELSEECLLKSKCFSLS